MLQPIHTNHLLDADGHPTGGSTCGLGFAVAWQNGPLGTGEESREPNGAFVETLLWAAADRLRFYNDNGFSCGENRQAIVHIERAIGALQARTERRQYEGVEGTYEGH